jgi:hypothetical protein
MQRLGLGIERSPPVHEQCLVIGRGEPQSSGDTPWRILDERPCSTPSRIRANCSRSNSAPRNAPAVASNACASPVIEIS